MRESPLATKEITSISGPEPGNDTWFIRVGAQIIQDATMATVTALKHRNTYHGTYDIDWIDVYVDGEVRRSFQVQYLHEISYAKGDDSAD